ncbi:hypothetical protein M3Y99_00035900 [Aphelenchoides fujianensis]|nr:hypothetical protein M3Y99_00035900 [Aphelenchoides fujianensis]
MNAKKLADNPPLGEDETFQTVRNGEKIWLFQEKYEDQEEYHYGHRVLSWGSSAVSFDLQTNKWDEGGFSAIPAILGENERGKLDDLVFTFAGSMFLLLFNRFEGLRLESLWKFDEQQKKWTKFADLNEQLEPAGDDHTFGNKLLLVKDDGKGGGPHFVAKINGGEQRDFLVFQLAVGENGAKVADLHRIRDLHSVLPVLDPLPGQSGVFITVAEHGCGYRWRTEEILRFDLDSKQLAAVEIGRENPSFGLFMATTHEYEAATDTWVFFGSPSRSDSFRPAGGDAEAEKKPQATFYAIARLGSERPVWQHSDQTIVDAQRDDLYVPLGAERSVVVISRKHGTLSVPLGSFSDIPRKHEEL